MKINIPRPMRHLWNPSLQYLGFYGGRGGGKTDNVAMWAALHGAEHKLRFLCAREVQKTLKESTMHDIMSKAESVGLGKDFRAIESKSEIVVSNGTKFIFSGLRDHTASSIKSISDIDVCIIEEAQSISKKSWDILLPTIRKPGSRVICLWNPASRTDPVDVFFRGKTLHPRAMAIPVNWRNNPFFPAELESLRIWCKENTPEDYEHIWEGGYSDGIGVKKVLPYEKLILCVGAHKKIGISEFTGRNHIGFDVADEGADKSAMAARVGAYLWHSSEWRASTLSQSSERVYSFAVAHGAQSVYYDASGVGAGVKSDFKRYQAATRLPFIAKPFLFGGAVNGGDEEFIRGVRNRDFFAKQNAQAWWNLRMRMDNTVKLLNGEKVQPSKCLFINDDIENLAGLLVQLSQAVYTTDTANGAGQIRVIKSPNDEPSPDRADAVVMAFAHDIKKGLKA